MAYSPKAYRLTVELILPRILQALDRLSPGVASSIIEGVVMHASEQLEQSGDQTLKEALFAAGELEPPIEAEPINAQPWLTDKDAMPATLEGQACARLAFTMIIETIWHLDRKDPQMGLVPHVLNAATLWASENNKERGGNDPLFTEMLRILNTGHLAAKKEWEARKPATE